MWEACRQKEENHWKKLENSIWGRKAKYGLKILKKKKKSVNFGNKTGEISWKEEHSQGSGMCEWEWHIYIIHPHIHPHTPTCKTRHMEMCIHMKVCNYATGDLRIVNMQWRKRGGVLRFELDRGVPLVPQNPYPSLRVISAKKGTHF